MGVAATLPELREWTFTDFKNDVLHLHYLIIVIQW